MDFVELHEQKRRQLKRDFATALGHIDDNLPLAKPAKLPKIDIEQNVSKTPHTLGYNDLLKTYPIGAWSSSPISLRELCMRGWKWFADKTVQCRSCERFLAITLPSLAKVGTTTYNKCLRHIREKLVSGHEIVCSFRSRTEDGRVSLRPAEILKLVNSNLKSTKLCDFSKINIETPEMDHRPLPPELQKLSPPLSVVAASLCGWRLFYLSTPHEYLTASCTLCRRDASFKLNCDSPEKFDVLLCHYHWCPLLDEDEDTGEYSWLKRFNVFMPKIDESRPLGYEVISARRSLTRYMALFIAEPAQPSAQEQESSSQKQK